MTESTLNQPKIIRPQAGFQMQFAASPADIVIGGGAAGTGKTFIICLDAIRWCLPHPSGKVRHQFFRAMIFRRTQPELKQPGGIWEEAERLAMDFGAATSPSKSLIQFPSGASIKFSHLQYQKDVDSHRSGQYTAIYFDELTTFLESQFWFMLSRNRSRAGVKPYIKATTNPQGQGWVKRLIAWWIYPDDYHQEHLQGMPRWDRAGKIRYFYRLSSTVFFWGDTRDEVLAQLKDNADEEVYELAASRPQEIIRSLTFIPGKLDDNQELLKDDPGYKGSLLALDDEDKAKYFYGSWKFYVTADTLFTPTMMMDAFTNQYVKEHQMGRGRRYLTADIAMEGSDMFVICCWQNWHLYRVERMAKTNGKEVEERIRRIMAEERIPSSRVAFDADGVGKFLSGFFKNSISITNGGSARKRLGEDEKDNYENQRAQYYYMFREKLKEDNCEVYLEAIESDMWDEVTKEFTATTKKIMPSGKLAIVSKDVIKANIGGKSPDNADAIVYRCAFELQWEEEEQEWFYGTSYTND